MDELTGGVEVAVVGWMTVDISEMKVRFKDFNLKWPEGDFDRLRVLRNQAEHHHLTEPVAALGEAIAASFPMVVDFFAALREDPREALGDTWDVILERRAAFRKVQLACLGELETIDWQISTTGLDRLSCINCGSSLVGQDDPENTEAESFHAKCVQCGKVFDVEHSIRMVVDAAFAVDAYIAAKESEESVINDCPHCAMPHGYVQNGDVNGCIACGFVLDETCARCGDSITLDDYVMLEGGLCSYCNHMSEKVMRE